MTLEPTVKISTLQGWSTTPGLGHVQHISLIALERSVGSLLRNGLCLTVCEQLNHGVRFLDFRVSKCLKDDRYYIVHSFCGPDLEDILNQIGQFALENEKECILIEVVPISYINHVELHQLFEKTLGDLLLKREPNDSKINPISLKLSHLVEKGRLVVFYKTPSFYTFVDKVCCFWNSQYLYAPFILSLDPEAKESFQLEYFRSFFKNYHELESKKHMYLFHFMYALTPGLSGIVYSALHALGCISSTDPTNLEECARKLNPRLANFTEKVGRQIEKGECSDIGMIISVDYVQESEVLKHVIALNQKKLEKS